MNHALYVNFVHSSFAPAGLTQIPYGLLPSIGFKNDNIEDIYSSTVSTPAIVIEDLPDGVVINPDRLTAIDSLLRPLSTFVFDKTARYTVISLDNINENSLPTVSSLSEFTEDEVDLLINDDPRVTLTAKDGKPVTPVMLNTNPDAFTYTRSLNVQTIENDVNNNTTMENIFPEYNVTRVPTLIKVQLLALAPATILNRGIIQRFTFTSNLDEDNGKLLTIFDTPTNYGVIPYLPNNVAVGSVATLQEAPIASHNDKTLSFRISGIMGNLNTFIPLDARLMSDTLKQVFTDTSYITRYTSAKVLELKENTETPIETLLYDFLN